MKKMLEKEGGESGIAEFVRLVGRIGGDADVRMRGG